MALKEKAARFDYEGVLSELGIAKGEQLWGKLQTASRSQRDLLDSQMIQDVSWVLTQLNDEERSYLVEIRKSISDAVVSAFGPKAMDALSEMGLTIESFILPIAKTLRQGEGIDEIPDELRQVVQGSHRPAPQFAAMFARYWIIERLPSHKLHREEFGQHLRIGWTRDCEHCGDSGISDAAFQTRMMAIHQGILEACRDNPGATGCPMLGDELVDKMRVFLGPYASNECLRVAACVRLSENTQHTVGEFVSEGDVNGAMTTSQILEFFGDDVVCPECSVWISVPQEAETNWVIQMVDGHNRPKGWCRIVCID